MARVGPHRHKKKIAIHQLRVPAQCSTERTFFKDLLQRKYVQHVKRQVTKFFFLNQFE